MCQYVQKIDNQRRETNPLKRRNLSDVFVASFAIKNFERLTDSKSKLVYKDLPNDDPKQRRPDITKAKEILQQYLDDDSNLVMKNSAKELMKYIANK